MPEEPITTESKIEELKVEELKVEELKVQEPAIDETTQVEESAQEPSSGEDQKVEEPAKEPQVQEQEKAPDLPEPAPEPAPAPPPTPPQPEPEPTPAPSPIKDERVNKTEDRSTKIEDDASSELKVEITLPVVVETPAAPLPRSSSEELTTGELAPALHDPKYTKGIPQKVLELTPQEINAARLLWGREHIAEAQAQANRNRKARMNSRMDEIVKIIKAGPETTTHAVAKGINLSEKSTSSYLQKLVHAGRIKATGNSSNRRYSA